MTLAEVMFESAQIESDMSSFFEQYDVYIESVIVEFKNGNINEASEDKSSEGAVVKLGKALQVLINKVLETLSKIAENIKNFFTGEKVKKQLTEAEKAAKTNPELKNVTVETHDPEAIAKAYDKGIAQLSKKLAKSKSGIITEADMKEVDAIVATTAKDVAKAKNKKKVALAAAIGTLIAFVGGYAVINNKDKNTVESLGKTKTGMYKMNSDEAFQDGEPYVTTESMLSKVSSKLANMVSKKHLDLDNILTTGFDSIKYAFQGMRPSAVPNGNKKTKYYNDEMFTDEIPSSKKKKKNYAEDDEFAESVELTESNQKEYLENLMIYVEAYDAHKGKRAYFRRTQEKYDLLEEKLKKLKDQEITNDEKLMIAAEASDILTLLLAEANKIPDDDFLDRIVDINFFINGVKKMLAVLRSKFSISKVVVFKPRTKRFEVLLSLRKYQRDLNKDIIRLHKEMKKEAKESVKVAKKQATTTESVTVGEYLESLENEVFGTDKNIVEGVTVGEYLDYLETELFE